MTSIEQKLSYTANVDKNKKVDITIGELEQLIDKKLAEQKKEIGEEFKKWCHYWYDDKPEYREIIERITGVKC